VSQTRLRIAGPFHLTVKTVVTGDEAGLIKLSSLEQQVESTDPAGARTKRSLAATKFLTLHKKNSTTRFAKSRKDEE